MYPTRCSIQTVQPIRVQCAGQSSLSYLPGLLALQAYWSAQESEEMRSWKVSV